MLLNFNYRPHCRHHQTPGSPQGTPSNFQFPGQNYPSVELRHKHSNIQTGNG